MDKPAFPPYFALLIGVISISFSAIFVKLASAPAPIIATYRLLFSVLLILPTLLVAKGVITEIAGISRKIWLLSLLSGAFLASHFLLWFESLRFTSVASSTVLVTLQPLFAFVGGYFLFGERLHPAAVVGGVLAIGGSFVIGWGDFQIGGEALFGDILALLGAATVTVYWLIGQYVRKALSLTAYTLVVYSASSICLLAYDLLFGYSLVGYPAADWGWFFLLALIPTLFGHSIFNWVIRWIPTSTVSMSILGEPVGTAILAYLILDEVVTIPQYIGGGIILLGIYLFMRWNTMIKEEKTDEQISPSTQNSA
ncbi:DMT family transporter [Brevibacillus humidisoli]|uniref:DMT family transporter n=1 Tax=Brevibacillus humidisoli TaxID=2895522 RepID=UPI001E3D58FC|nr:DMT family transporter [Brevibacillus humidisoli]UFJ41536.1 DMT family transporter [Brevibacillus humidisoli]